MHLPFGHKSKLFYLSVMTMSALGSLLYTGCSIESTTMEKPKHEEENNQPVYNLNWPNAVPQKCGDNPDAPIQPNSACYEQDDYKWRVNCRSASCQEIPVFVHYMLTNDLGGESGVMIEAFDNPHFVGSPISNVQVGHFDASGPGKFTQANLYLAPGTYYLRAYLSRDGETTTPYSYGDMQLVGERPVGVFGAASSASNILVKPRSIERWAQPVHIYLDKLFQKPGTVADTHALLHIRFAMAEGATAPDGRLLRIGLYKDADLAKVPVVSMQMPTENLLVNGRIGKADFTSTSLPVGKYIVSAYIDTNGNDFQDSDEAGQLFMQNGQPYLLSIEANRTATIEMVLATPKAPAQ